MEVNLLIPNPDLLPVPAWIFNALLILTFTLHILITNAMLGAGIIGFLNWGKWTHNHPSPQIDRGIAKRTAIGIALSVNFGVAPLLFMQVLYGQFIYVSSVLMAFFWISIFVLSIGAYYAVYASDLLYEKLAGKTRWLMGACVLLIALVGFFFTKSVVLMINPSAWAQYFANPFGTMMQTQDLSTLPRYLHFLASSLALGGLAIAYFGKHKKKTNQSHGENLMNRGFIWFAYATLINFAFGAWYLGGIPSEVLGRVFGPNPYAMLVFMVGIVLGLGSITTAFSRHLGLTTGLSVGSVLFMVLFRYELREAYLSPFWDMSKMPVSTQLSPLLVFVLILLLGVSLVAYVLKLAMAKEKEAN